ncbi:MAG: hypothetical protein AB7D28_08460 [Candidatus Berkiella sp.]
MTGNEAAQSESTQSNWLSLKAKGLGKYLWDRYIEEAAPTERHIDVAYVPIQRKENDAVVDVGVVVPELYMIAQAGILPAQVKAKKFLSKDLDKLNDADKKKLLAEKPALYKALFLADGQMKSAFELSVISSYHRAYIQASLSHTYFWLRKNGFNWPNTLSKVRAVPDYLAGLEKAGLCVKDDGSIATKPAQEPTSGEYCFGAHSVRLSIKNPPEVASKREKIMHFLGPWFAWFVTVSAAVAVTGATSPVLLLAYALGTYIAMECANEFGMFDTAESLYRDIGWMISKEYSGFGKFSVKNALHALVQIAAIGLIAYGAATAAFYGTLALPFLQLVPQVAIGIAGFFASVAALGSSVGLAAATRYIRGISIYDNQIPLSVEEAARLRVVTKDSEKAKKHAMAEDGENLMARLDQALDSFAKSQDISAGVLLSKKGKNILQQAMTAALKSKPVAANDVPEDLEATATKSCCKR